MGNKKTKCKICGKSFVDIKGHRKRIHDGKKACDICGKALKNVERHKQRMHSNGGGSQKDDSPTPQEVRITIAGERLSEEDITKPLQTDSGQNKLALEKTWVSEKQTMRLVQQTPKKYVYTRPAKGGGTWDYVPGWYVEKVLNFVFGWLWDFEVIKQERVENQVVTLGKLTVYSPDMKKHITKTQNGRADIKFKKNTKKTLDIGNDYKASATDALKKCASLLGIASDIYGKVEYKSETGQKFEEEVKEERKEMTKEELEKYVCHGARKSGCGESITPKEYEYSKKIYDKPLCRNCQKLAYKKK